MLRKITKYINLKNIKKNKKIVFFFVVTVSLFVLFGRNLITNDENGVKKQKVTRGSLKATVSASGVVEGDKQASIHFQSPGKVSWVGVTEGEEVKRGQALAKLDMVQLNSSLQISLSNLRAAEATLGRVYDGVKGHDGDESFTQKETRTLAEAAKDNAYESVISAQQALSNSTLISPFNGVVVSISDNITPGVNIALSDTIVVADISRFKFIAQVDEVDYGKITLGQKAEISLDAFPDEVFEGNVSYIGKSGVKTAGGGVTIPIEIHFDAKGNNMVVGLSGDVEFIVEEKNNVLVVPREYVKNSGGNSFVYVMKNGNQEERTVKTGLSTLSQIEIIEGLEEGEEVFLPKNNKK